MWAGKLPVGTVASSWQQAAAGAPDCLIHAGKSGVEQHVAIKGNRRLRNAGCTGAGAVVALLVCGLL